jgi:hypothetical protein
MFPFSGFFVYGLVMTSIFSGVIGMLAGFLTARAFRFSPTAMWKNGIIGAAAFNATFYASWLIPYQNTVTSKMDHGTATITMSHYQYGDILGYILAGVFPILYVLVRFRRSRRNSPSA